MSTKIEKKKKKTISKEFKKKQPELFNLEYYTK